MGTMIEDAIKYLPTAKQAFEQRQWADRLNSFKHFLWDKYQLTLDEWYAGMIAQLEADCKRDTVQPPPFGGKEKNCG